MQIDERARERVSLGVIRYIFDGIFCTKWFNGFKITAAVLSLFASCIYFIFFSCIQSHNIYVCLIHFFSYVHFIYRISHVWTVYTIDYILFNMLFFRCVFPLNLKVLLYSIFFSFVAMLLPLPVNTLGIRRCRKCSQIHCLCVFSVEHIKNCSCRMLYFFVVTIRFCAFSRGGNWLFLSVYFWKEQSSLIGNVKKTEHCLKIRIVRVIFLLEREFRMQFYKALNFISNFFLERFCVHLVSAIVLLWF